MTQQKDSYELMYDFFVLCICSLPIGIIIAITGFLMVSIIGWIGLGIILGSILGIATVIMYIFAPIPESP